MQMYIISRRPRRYGTDFEVSTEQAEQMRALSKDFNPPKTKSLTMGKVRMVDEKEVWIDIGGKSEGVLPIEEFNLRGFGEKIHVGDTVEVWLQETSGQNEHGSDKQKYSSISFAKAAQMRAWRSLEANFKSRKLVDGIILSKTPGGYVVSILPYGARGFLPLSQTDPQMSKSNEVLQKYKTQIHQYLIIRMERSWNVILSRREATMIDQANPTTEEEKPEQSNEFRKKNDAFQPKRRRT